MQHSTRYDCTKTTSGVEGIDAIAVDKEFKELCPPLTAEERNLLDSSIEREGCRDPISVWNGLIVDGHKCRQLCGEVYLASSH